MNKINKLCIFILLCLPLAAEAKVKCWTDKNNQRQCGDTIPPEYANSNVIRYTEQGTAERRVHKLTPEELRAKTEAEQQQQSSRALEMEANRRDSTLLNTFSNEQEIDLARDRNLQQIDARLSSLNQLLKSATSSLTELRKQEETLLSRQQAIPPNLKNAIASGEEKVLKLQKQVAQSEQESAKITARFAADKTRYRELRGADQVR
jgi:hypothetical protein